VKISVVLILIAITFYVGLGYVIYNYWRVAYEFLLQFFPKGLLIPLVGSLLGFTLYLIRTIARVEYGMVEIMFGGIGMVGAANAVTSDTATLLIQVAGGIYIIVRGLDNIKAGLNGPENTTHFIRPLWNYIYGDDGRAFLRRIGLVKEFSPLYLVEFTPYDSSF
jgi:hypothetical protein